MNQLRLPSIDDWRVDFWTGCIKAVRPAEEGVRLKYAWMALLRSYYSDGVLFTAAAVTLGLGSKAIKPGAAVAVVGGVAAVYGTRKVYIPIHTEREKR